MLDAGVDTRRASQSARGACEPRADFGDVHTPHSPNTRRG